MVFIKISLDTKLNEVSWMIRDGIVSGFKFPIRGTEH